MQRKNYGQRRIGMIVASVVGLFLIIVVPITGFFYTKNGIKNLDQSFATNKYLNDFDDGLVIKGIITQIDPINSYFKTQFTFVPIGSFSDANPAVKNSDYFAYLYSNTYLPVARSRFIPISNLTITIDSKVFVFLPSSPTVGQEMIVSFESGDVAKYPLDSYIGELEISGFYYSNNIKTSIPIAYISSSELPLYNVATVVSEDAFTNTIFSDLLVTRSVTTTAFSWFVIVIMWILSLLVFTMSCSIWIRGRKIEPPSVAIAAALLFALPALRNVQPGIPPIGVFSDVIGFFWNMMIVGVSVCMNIINYLVSYKQSKPKEVKAEETK